MTRYNASLGQLPVSARRSDKLPLVELSRRSLLQSAWLLPIQDSTFSVEVKVVTLFAVVHRPDGQAETNLSKDDFSLEEDGRRQIIRYFSRESDLPLTLGILVDTSKSEAHILEAERRASYAFLDKVLRPDRDRAFVAHFDMRFGVVQSLTSSRQDLAAALARLKIPVLAGTLLYTGLKRASEDVMRKQSGRKAFILLSDGVDYGSSTSIGTAIEYVQRADTIIFSILFADPRNRSRRGPEVMQRLADETGGRYFEVSQENPIDKIFAQIEDELRHQYSIGYTPDRIGDSRGFRKIRLTTRYAGLVVRTRDGYYPN
jgi:VWFA-related protein